jgi:hypothetical protein
VAIRDLLWCCPRCRTSGGIRPAGKGWEVCEPCGARYRRRQGAFIELVAPGDPATLIRHARDWVGELPDITVSFGPQEAGPLAMARVTYRLAAGTRAIHHRGTFLGTIERLAAPRHGSLELHADRVRVAPAGEGEVAGLEFALESLTAIQASSSTLQIKPRRTPLVAFRFPEGSARYWEEALRAALRDRYRALGLGEIIEFQPRIAVR